MLIKTFNLTHFFSIFVQHLKTRFSLQVLCDAKEYDELPVRHNEDLMNKDLSKDCPIDLSDRMMDSPATKAHLLLQSHFGHLQLPCSDYFTDTKSVLDQAIRILQVARKF